MITAEKALEMAKQRKEEIENEGRFFWFTEQHNRTSGLKEAQIEEYIERTIQQGERLINLKHYEITDLGKQKLKELGYTIVDLSNVSPGYASSVAANSFFGAGPKTSYVILFDQADVYSVKHFYMSAFNISEDSIEVY